MPDFIAQRPPRPIMDDEEFSRMPAGWRRSVQKPLQRFSASRPAAPARKPAPARVPAFPWPASRGLGGRLA